MCRSLPKRHSISIVSIRNISPHLADLHLKTTIQTHRKEKQLEGRAIAGRNEKRTLLVKKPNFLVNERVKNKSMPKKSVVVLALPNSVTKQSKPLNCQYGAVSIAPSFADNVELNVASRTYIKTHSSCFA